MTAPETLQSAYLHRILFLSYVYLVFSLYEASIWETMFVMISLYIEKLVNSKFIYMQIIDGFVVFSMVLSYDCNSRLVIL